MPRTVMPIRYARMIAMSSALMVRATSLDDISLHREVFGEAEAVELLRRPLVARLHPLPELPLVVAAGEGRRVLLRLVLEDRLDLESQLLLRQRHQPGRLVDRPLRPRAAVEPHVRAAAPRLGLLRRGPGPRGRVHRRAGR